MRLEAYDQRYYPEIAFGGIPRSDGVIQFYTRLQSLVGPESILVDFGCGRGQHTEDPVLFRRNLRNFKGKVAKVIGLDVDTAGRTNPTIDEFRLLAQGAQWPLLDESVDLVFSDYVLEHLPEPAFFFSEARRVLHPGGHLCLVTPNLLSYFGIASKLVPNRFHARIVARVQAERKVEDVFPTLYRCNTLPAIRRAMKKHGFQVAAFGFDPGPGYLTFSEIAYMVGYLHQQIAPSLIRPIIMAFGRKVT